MDERGAWRPVPFLAEHKPSTSTRFRLDRTRCHRMRGGLSFRRTGLVDAHARMRRVGADGAHRHALAKHARCRYRVPLRAHQRRCRCARTARKSAHFRANRASRRVRGMNRSHAFATSWTRAACCACARAISPAAFPKIEQCQAFQRLVLVLSEAEEAAPGRPPGPLEGPQSGLCEHFQRVRCAHSVDTAKCAD